MVSFTVAGDASILASSDRSQSPRIAPAFASLGWALLGSNNAELQSVKEKRTGVEFQGEFCYRRGQRGCPRLTGAGVRTKKIAGIKSLDVYALALYVDEYALHGAMHRKFSKSTPERLAKDQALFDELCKAANIEKSLVLVMTSGLVNRKNFLDTLDARLEPPITKAKETPALDSFKKAFDVVKFRKGLEISFTFMGNKVVTKADGVEIGTVNNKALSNAMLDAYLGRDPVSPGAKNAFAVGLTRMVLA